MTHKLMSVAVIWHIAVSSHHIVFSVTVIYPSISFNMLYRTCFERKLNYFCMYITFQVSWVKRKGDELNLITFGRHTYSSDSRYTLDYQPPNDWQLEIQFANERDEGHYECQVSAHPPLVLLVYLTVVGK